jgi:hypothetical protein
MPRRRRKRGEERISEKDLEVLEFVARFGLVPRSAVAVRAKTGRSVTLDRERRLREGDLIEAHPAVLTPGALLTATRRGLRLCGREELRPQRYSLWSIRHRPRTRRRPPRARRRAPALRARARGRRATRGAPALLGAALPPGGLAPPRSDPVRTRRSRGDRGRADQQGAAAAGGHSSRVAGRGGTQGRFLGDLPVPAKDAAPRRASGQANQRRGADRRPATHPPQPPAAPTCKPA